MIIFLILTILSGIFYRMGGSDKYNKNWRDIGVPFLGYLLFLYLTGFNLSSMVWLAFGLSYASMTTYHKWLNKYFNKPTTDCFWFNWAMTGLCYGLSAIPLHYIGISLYTILIRTVILALFTMIWSEYNDDVIWEEVGRGVLFTSTIPLLMIGV